MNVLRSGIVTMLLLAAFSVQAACTCLPWEQFKKDYISQEGRVIDPSDARKITTSEGQSYGMFFALAANDRAAFDNILDWTQNNLAQGSLKERLPAWLWGKKENSKWEVLDSNSASDGDIWMALLVAGGGAFVERAALYRHRQRVAKTYRAGGSGDGAWAGFHVVTGQSGFC